MALPEGVIFMISRHRDQLRPRQEGDYPPGDVHKGDDAFMYFPLHDDEHPCSDEQSQSQPRYPKRQRQPPVRFTHS